MAAERAVRRKRPRAIPLDVILEVSDSVHPKYADLALRAAIEAAQRFERTKLGSQVDSQRRFITLSVFNAIKNERRSRAREVFLSKAEAEAAADRAEKNLDQNAPDIQGFPKLGQMFFVPSHASRAGTRYPREYESVDGLLRVDHREIQFRMALAVGALPEPESGLIARMYYDHSGVLSLGDVAKKFGRSKYWAWSHHKAAMALLAAMPEVQWCGLTSRASRSNDSTLGMARRPSDTANQA